MERSLSKSQPSSLLSAEFVPEGPASMVLAGLRAAPSQSVDGLVQGGGVLIVAPHADDETLGCGGLIRRLIDENVAVAVDILTDGARSHLNSASYPSARLVALRQDEARAAANTLGMAPSAVQFHDQPDGFLGYDPERADRVVDTLVRRIEECRAAAVFVTCAADPHPDHQAAFLLTRRAVRRAHAKPVLYAYPIWAWTAQGWISLGEGAARPHRLDISGQLQAKRAAIDCYGSQLGRVIKDAPDGFTLSAADLKLFLRPHEVFVEFAA